MDDLDLSRDGNRAREQANDGNVRSIAVLQPKTKDCKASSWIDIYNETTTLSKRKTLLGREIEIDDGKWRVFDDMLGCKTVPVLLLCLYLLV